MSKGTTRESGGAQGSRRATVAVPDSARGGKGRWWARCKVTVVWSCCAFLNLLEY